MTKPSYEEFRITKHSGSPQIADSARDGKRAKAAKETRKDAGEEFVREYFGKHVLRKTLSVKQAAEMLMEWRERRMDELEARVREITDPLGH